ncbi:MAG: hypothetical protein M1319_01415 [Chloroflexi bacterium]|nr:hypothetical protein [Chloroflexota bacterium]
MQKWEYCRVVLIRRLGRGGEKTEAYIQLFDTPTTSTQLQPEPGEQSFQNAVMREVARLGREGWELVTMAVTEPSPLKRREYILKRPLEEPPVWQRDLRETDV